MIAGRDQTHLACERWRLWASQTHSVDMSCFSTPSVVQSHQRIKSVPDVASRAAVTNFWNRLV